MIGRKNLHVTAERANFPLGALHVRQGSAANVALFDVPERAGISISRVWVRLCSCDGVWGSYDAVKTGSLWVVDIPAAAFATPGTVDEGVEVWAAGFGADGETSASWSIGVGDLCVLDGDSAAPVPGDSWATIRVREAEPEAPVRCDAYFDAGTLYVYDGSAWIGFATAATLGYRFARQAVYQDNYVVSARDRRVNYLQVVGDVYSLTLVLPADAGDYVRDLIVDVENLTGHAVVAEFWNLDEDYRVVVPDGESLAEMTAFDAGSMARLYVTQTGFSGGGLPVFEVRRADVAMADDGYYYYDE